MCPIRACRMVLGILYVYIINSYSTRDEKRVRIELDKNRFRRELYYYIIIFLF